MHRGFWSTVARKKPFLALAPMADVTDAAFRRIVAKHGKPDVLWTEFVSADGLMSPGKAHLLVDLQYAKTERPIVAQLFGAHPETMEGAAHLAAELGFDGVDINMGCPDRAVMRQGAGGALIRTPEIAVAVIEAAKRGVARAAKKGSVPIPVSVKTRIGYNRNELVTWLPTILETGVAAVTIHCRTVKEQSLVPARWEHVAEAVRIRDRVSPETLILGNGDVRDRAQAIALAKETLADGVMIGRGIFGNPWLFNARRKRPPSVKEKLDALIELAKLFHTLIGKRKSFAVLKKHFKAFVNGFDGAKELRIELMEGGNDPASVAAIIRRFRSAKR